MNIAPQIEKVPSIPDTVEYANYLIASTMQEAQQTKSGWKTVVIVIRSKPKRVTTAENSRTHGKELRWKGLEYILLWDRVTYRTRRVRRVVNIRSKGLWWNERDMVIRSSETAGKGSIKLKSEYGHSPLFLIEKCNATCNPIAKPIMNSPNVK